MISTKIVYAGPNAVLDRRVLILFVIPRAIRMISACAGEDYPRALASLSDWKIADL